MTGTITVSQAISRGYKLITLGTIAILVGCIAAGGIMAALTGQAIFLGLAIGTGVGLLSSGIYSARIITKWRIWAFSRVNDVHELRIAAIAAAVIPETGSWQEKLEIRTRADKKALQEIQARFDAPYQFVDESDVPPETKIYYASPDIAVRVLVGSAILVTLALLALPACGLNPYTGLMLITGATGLVAGKMLRPKGDKRIPALILSNAGITTPTRTDTWDNISDENIVREESHSRNGTTIHFKLRYKAWQRQLPDIDLDDISIPIDRVVHLLYFYRKRYEAATTATA